MADSAKSREDAQEFWYSGKITRRRFVGYGTAAGALGATMLVPAPWWAAFGQAKPYKIGTLQPLSGLPPPAARPRWSAPRWRSIASTSRAASMAGRSS